MIAHVSGIGTALMERPRCDGHPDRYMELRTGDLTYEQKWCGTWYDCTQCHSSVLFRSPELERHLKEQRERTNLDLFANPPKPKSRRRKRGSA